MLLHPHNEPHSLIDQRRLRQLTSLRPHMRVIVFQHKLVDVYLANPSRNTALRNLIRETVGAVQHDADAAGDLFADGFESVSDSRLLAKEDNRCTKKEHRDSARNKPT
jgi:hypothetical protein